MSRALVWFRRDLRNRDHAALYQALKASKQVFCVFVFDTDILDRLPSKQDRRVEFIWHSVIELRQALQKDGGDLWVAHGKAKTLLPELAKTLKVDAVYTNHDYEPEALERDEVVRKELGRAGIVIHTYKDQVIFEKDEVLTAGKQPYKVFTPYKNAWLSKLEPFFTKPYPVERYTDSLAAPSEYPQPLREWSLEDLGFEKTNLTEIPIRTGMTGAEGLLADFLERMPSYKERRDFPAQKGPSYLSVHLRFGTVSIRRLVHEAEKRIASSGAECWLGELIWRDFYFMILHHFPYVAKGAFHKELDGISFPSDKRKIKAWCEAKTGYPIVDAAMRQLNRTGYMHNRLRMIAASFLVKDLHVDWRAGEKYFKEHLLDYDLAANNGGWQWCASTGCDAQPYFRIFNPVTQSEKFDPYGKFIRKYIPELQGFDAKRIHAPWLASAEEQAKAGCVVGKDYPAPIVDHADARALTLELYKRKGRS